jgi:hypothetical protein
MRLRSVLMLAVALVALLVFAFVRSAATGAPIDLPTGFVHLRDSGTGFRALTSDDARLWVRAWKDPTEASVQFWADMLQQDLVQRGYERKGGGEAKDQTGRTGLWHEFDANVRGERVHYLIAVWVDGAVVQAIEFGASGDAYGKHLPAVQAAFATLRR